MVYVWIGGGLGNQIYQYAFYQQLKILIGKKNVKADTFYMRMSGIHNGYELKSALGLTPTPISISALLNKWTKRTKIVFEDSFSFQEIRNSITLKKDIYLRGFWQSLDYFENDIKTLVEDIKFPTHKLQKKNKEYLSNIRNSNSIAIHVRRGNYFKNDNFYETFGKFCDNEYHKIAIEKISDLVENPTFFFFSDDIDYCKKNIHTPQKKTFYIDSNKREKSFWDMYLMSQCKHNIIANSTFSWWGAFLNQKPDKIVVAPKIWFKDDKTKNRLPPEWITIDNSKLF